MTSEAERLARLRRTLHSLATRVPKIILTRVDRKFPVLKSKTSVKLDEASTEAAQFSKDVNAEEILGAQTAEFYSCEICKKSFSLRNILLGHTSVNSRETASYCEMCVRSLSDNRSAMQRFRGRERPFACNVCNKSFTTRYNLDTHNRVHTGERPFSCKMCKKMFAQRCNLNIHIRVHSGERPFSCEECKKTFTLRSNLIRHLIVHSGERPFTCEVCKERFANRSTIIRHLRVHTGERPYSCKFCKKPFTRSFTLNMHLRSHSTG